MIQQDGLGERLIPAQIQIYPDQAYNDDGQRRTYNIYKFSKQRGEFQDYNIIPCFEETHLLHLLIKMDWQMDMDLQAIAELQRYARYSVRTTAKITSLRVQNIEVIPPSLPPSLPSLLGNICLDHSQARRGNVRLDLHDH